MSDRNYLTIDELEEFSGITVTDEAEGLDQISQAEAIIDSYSGFQEKAIECEYKGRAVAGSSNSITLAVEHQDTYEVDYFTYCVIEIIGGTGIGQKQVCLSSTRAGVLTVDSWDTAPDSTSYYRIFQLGNFPRLEDSHYDAISTPIRYYKFIPEKVRRAVAAQIEYKIAMGDEFFATNKASLQSESIGDYSYSKFASDSSRLDNLIAPKAKMLLRGIRNIVGEMNE
jgi:hypothetical protein